MKAMDDQAIFCENIRLLRQTHRLSKKAMAQALQISVRSLSMIENGTIPPKLGCEMLFCASEHFRIPIRALFLPRER